MHLKLSTFVFTASVLSFSLQPLGSAVLTLDSVLRLTAENNFAIRQADSRVAEAQARSGSAAALRLPSLDLLGRYQRVDDHLLVTGGDDESWGLDLQLTQPLYAGGAIRSAIDQSDLLLAAAQAEYQAVANGVLLQVKTAWFAALLARESVAVRSESVSLLEAQLQTVRDRYAAGSVSRFELLRAEVALANGRPALIRAQNAFEAAIIELLQVVGLSHADPKGVTLRGELAYHPRSFELAQLLAEAGRLRAELSAASAAFNAAQRAVDAVRANQRPQVNLVAAYGLQKSPLSRAWDDTLDGWRVGIQGAWNVWDGGKVSGDQRVARARAHQAELSIDELELQIAAEVRRAYLDHNEAVQLVTASRRVVEQATEALALAEDRYAVGSAIQLEVLEAQVSLTEARTNELEALFAHEVAIARILRATGQLSR